jgi:hypothetical protein
MAGRSVSIYLTPEEEEALNLRCANRERSSYIKALIFKDSNECYFVLATEINRLLEEQAKLKNALDKIQEKIEENQAKLRKIDQRIESKDQTADKARKKILEFWYSCAKEVRPLFKFQGLLTGPANTGLIAEAGFGTEDEVIDWCKTQGVKR